jgi:hypothetical protein
LTLAKRAEKQHNVHFEEDAAGRETAKDEQRRREERQDINANGRPFAGKQHHRSERTRLRNWCFAHRMFSYFLAVSVPDRTRSCALFV